MNQHTSSMHSVLSCYKIFTTRGNGNKWCGLLGVPTLVPQGYCRATELEDGVLWGATTWRISVVQSNLSVDII